MDLTDINSLYIHHHLHSKAHSPHQMPVFPRLGWCVPALYHSMLPMACTVFTRDRKRAYL